MSDQKATTWTVISRFKNQLEMIEILLITDA